MGDRVRVQFSVRDIYLFIYPLRPTHSGHPFVWVGAVNALSQRAVTPYGCGVKAGLHE